MPKKYNRSFDELKSKAVFRWPEDLAQIERDASIIPRLIETQDKFLSLLVLADTPEKVFELVETSEFPGNLFLKHLVVLADFGGEQLKRLNERFAEMFPSDEQGPFLAFFWGEQEHVYRFRGLPINGFGNPLLGIDGPGLATAQPLDDLKRDVATILLFGSASEGGDLAQQLEKCDIGNLLGKKEDLEKYVKQKYIWVSRITAGAQANSLGQIAQTFVCDYLAKKLGDRYEVVRNGTIAVGRQRFPFDIVASRAGKEVGVEVAFQVTTNSVIERKAGQAKNRQKLLHKAGASIAYVIDGAGNFNRKSAITTICKHSDCTVAYSEEEFDLLVDFIEEKTA